jgi:uncharacterized protein
MERLLKSLFRWRQRLTHGLRSRLSICLIAIVLVSTVTLLPAAPAHATSANEIPKPDADTWVIDRAEVLSRFNEGKLNADLADLAQRTGNEVHFVTIHRLDYDETIDSFANDLFQKWFPTPAAQANQTLLVLDNITNNSAIKTGAAVKQTLSDETAQSVAQETVQVPLKQGNKYNQALLNASDRLIAVLSGKADPGAPEVKDDIQVEGTFATREQTEESNATVWVIGFLVVATIVPMATYYFYLYLQSR